MRTSSATLLYISILFLSYFIISDAEEITVALYLLQNDSILNVKDFVWQGNIKILLTQKFLEGFSLLRVYHIRVLQRRSGLDFR